MGGIPVHQRTDRSELFDEDFVDETHVAAFAKALSEPSAGVEQINAFTDFVPINARIRRRAAHAAGNRSSSRTGGGTSGSHAAAAETLAPPPEELGWGYSLGRWPLLFFLGLVIVVQFACYVVVRQVVNFAESFLYWRGHLRALRLKLRQAETEEEWQEAALALDKALGREDWKYEKRGAYVDASLLAKVIKDLKSARAAGDATALSDLLAVCIKSNFAGFENWRLYSQCYSGTKQVVTDYVSEVERSLQFVLDSTSADLALEQKRAFFRGLSKNFGKSCLCLSGGAGFSYYHIGVVRALLDANLLPHILSGTSAGGLIAALVCCYRDDELDKILVPQLAEKITACQEGIAVWLPRYWRTGARFDSVPWFRKAMFFTRGSLTFREAFELTGRALNISVIPSDHHSPSKLLNHITSPDAVIASALLASAAVPGILNPVVLMAKSRDGSVVPYSFATKWVDGSIRTDIPLQSLALHYNATFSIVSQSNPHVHLFFYNSRGRPGRPVSHRKGKGWRGGFFLSAAEKYLKVGLLSNLRIIRDLELMPRAMATDWSFVFLQRFEGSLTLVPKTRFMDWIEILSDPSRDELARKIWVGQQTAWPAMHMIRHRYRVERAIQNGRDQIRAKVRQARPTKDQQGVSTALAASAGLMPPPARTHPGHSAASTPSGEQPPLGGRGDYFTGAKTHLDGQASHAGLNGAPAPETMTRTDSRLTAVMSDSSDVEARYRPRHQSDPLRMTGRSRLPMSHGYAADGSDRTDWDDSDEMSDLDEY